MRLVVVGGDAAGMTVASQVRRLRDDAEIVAFERGPYTSYSMCGIPFYVGGEFSDAQDLVVRQPADFAKRDIDVHILTEVVSIDADARQVRVRNLRDGSERDEPYDELVYAAGAHPVVPPLPGAREFGHVVHTLDEGEQVRRLLEQRDDVDHAIVVGAGYIGLEIAESLVTRGIPTTLLDRADQVMLSLDPDMAGHVEAALRNFGVKVRLGESFTEVRRAAGDDGTLQVVTEDGVYEAQAIICATGAKPNVELAAQAGCEVGPSGALVVDGRMHTTVDGIWAAGDCVETTNLVSGAKVNVQLGTHANKQGKVAALNIAGQRATFPGVVGTAVTKLCNWEIARTGLSEREASAADLDYAVTVFEGTAKAGYMPEPGEVYVKVLAEHGSGRVLGAQLVGTGNVAKRIDAAATWCQTRMSVADVQFLDLSYAPPFGGVWDLLQTGARNLTRVLGLHPQL